MSAALSTSSGEFGKSSSNASGVEPSRQAEHHKVRCAATWRTLHPILPSERSPVIQKRRARRCAITAGVLLASLIALPVVWAQERPPLDLSSLTIAGTVNAMNIGEIGVIGCAKKEDHFVCNFFLRDMAKTIDFNYPGSFWSTKLVDNFRIDHPLLRGYFLNGLGQRIVTVTLGKDDWIWVVQEFAGPIKEITTVRVVFLGLGNQSVVVSLGDSGATGGAPRSP